MVLPYPLYPLIEKAANQGRTTTSRTNTSTSTSTGTVSSTSSATGSSEEDAGNGGVKLIWWYASVRTGADKVDATQTAVESFESEFFGVDEALRRATFQTDRDVIARPVELVRATYPEARGEQESALAEPRPEQNTSEVRLGAVPHPRS